MKTAASKLESIPSIIISGRGQERIMVISSGKRSRSRFCPLPWESLTRISVAPAALAPSIAARTSAVMNSLNREYSNPSGPSCSGVTAPATPSRSAEI